MIAPNKPPARTTPVEMLEDAIARLEQAKRLLKWAIFLFGVAGLEFAYQAWRLWPR